MNNIIHCRTCRRNSEPIISYGIKKCGHCNSINYREATKDERLNVTPLPVKDEGLKIFGA